MSQPYNIEVSHKSVDADPFYSTRSPHPFSFTLGDFIEGDARLAFEDKIERKLNTGEKLFVIGVQQYLFTSDGTLPARNLRIAVDTDPAKGPSVYEKRGLRTL